MPFFKQREFVTYVTYERVHSSNDIKIKHRSSQFQAKRSGERSRKTPGRSSAKRVTRREKTTQTRNQDETTRKRRSEPNLLKRTGAKTTPTSLAMTAQPLTRATTTQMRRGERSRRGTNHLVVRTDT